MQISTLIICGIKINVVNNFSRLSLSDLSMFPLTARAFRSISQFVIGASEFFMQFISALRRFARRVCQLNYFGSRTNHLVASPQVCAARKSANLFSVSIKRIAMSIQHLIMAIAQLFCNRWAITVQARPANDSSAPSVVSRSMFLDALVVHKAQSVCRVLSSASFNLADSFRGVFSHSSIISGNRKVSNEQIAKEVA